MKIRALLGRLHDSQFTEEAREYARQVAARRHEDEASIREFLTCGHVDWADVLKQALE